jgi:ABC-2 type transport system ATP-binding protein
MTTTPASLRTREIVLSVRGVSKRFGNHQALHEVSFEMGRGTICALLGANGAGKTTLLKIIMELIPRDCGEVECPLAKGGETWFSYVPEEAGLYERMRVENIIAYFGRLSGMTKPEVDRAIDPWLGRFELKSKRRAYTIELSKGNQQKVKLICALISRPPVLILDEPFTGLDGEASALLRQCLVEVKAEGTTLLMSSHRLDQMDLLADHVVVLQSGKKILDATLREARRLYRQNRIEVSFGTPPPAEKLEGLAGVLEIEWDEGVARLMLGPGAIPQRILRELFERGCEVENFIRHSPDLQEIFHAAARLPASEAA